MDTWWIAPMQYCNTCLRSLLEQCTQCHNTSLSKKKISTLLWQHLPSWIFFVVCNLCTNLEGKKEKSIEKFINVTSRLLLLNSTAPQLGFWSCFTPANTDTHTPPEFKFSTGLLSWLKQVFLEAIKIRVMMIKLMEKTTWQRWHFTWCV